MKIIRRSEFKSMPWKNGGGATHEIARNGQSEKILWRLSIADVTQDGPFSLFEGLRRSLTVIAGNGMGLHDAAGNVAHSASFFAKWVGQGCLSSQRVHGEKLVSDTQ